MGYIAKISKTKETNVFNSDCPDTYITKLHRELFYTWCFLAQEGLLDEASEFLKDHRNIPTPLEAFPM